VIDPAIKPSRTRIKIKSKDERVERRDGRDRRCRGRRVVGRTLWISGLRMVGWTYIMKPIALNVLLEIEGKITESVSPNKTTKATLNISVHIYIVLVIR
jgi:hypothetical protein